MNIVLTGSLGHISQPLATELVRQGHAVTIISSKAEKQPEIEALGARAAIGSVADADFLATAFAGADAVYVMVPPSFGEPDQIAYYQRLARAYAQAIARTGVQRVVHLSSYGAHLDKGTGFILGAHHAENILNTLPNVALTHLRPGYFYYNLFNFVDMIKGAGFIGTNFGADDALVLVAPADIATAAAEELTTPAAPGQHVRYVASDERPAREVAQVLGTAIGRPDLQWMVFSDAQTQAAMEQRGMPAALAANFVELGAATHSGVLREDYDRHRPAAMGRVKTEDFAREFAAAFAKGGSGHG